MAAETSGAITKAHFTIEVNSDERTNREFLTALLDRNCNNNDGEVFEFAHNYYANTLKTNDFCTSLEQLVRDEGARSEGACSNPLDFFKELGRVYSRQLLMREELQQLENNAVEDLDGIKYWKKASAVLFTAASATSAAVAAANAANLKRPAVGAAAAAASVMFAALGSWVHSILRKKENAVNKRREIVRVMIMGAKIAMTDLANIYVLARRCQFDVESMSELMADGGATDGVREKLTALGRSLGELRGEADDGYSRDMGWVREMLLQTILEHVE